MIDTLADVNLLVLPDIAVDVLADPNVNTFVAVLVTVLEFTMSTS